MATIRKRGVRWHCQVRKKGFEPVTKSFRTKDEAERWARATEAEMDVGSFTSRREAESTTLNEVLLRYEQDITSRKRGARQELSQLKQLRQLPLAMRYLAAIRSSDIVSIRDAWLKQGLKPSTVLRRLALLSHVFAVCRSSWGFESLQNPVEYVAKPRADDARSRRVAAEELTAILEATNSPVLKAAIRLAVETAMRRSELAGLAWKNVDLHKRVARLPLTKNGASRDVPLSPGAIDVLASVPRASNATHVLPVRADAITRAFDRSVERARRHHEEACKAEGRAPSESFLLDLRFHDLRHEATSRLACKLPAMLELAAVTGHKDLRMLKRYYHANAEDLAQKLAAA